MGTIVSGSHPLVIGTSRKQLAGIRDTLNQIRGGSSSNVNKTPSDPPVIRTVYRIGIRYSRVENPQIKANAQDND
jgi:hypothetical protein